MPTNLVDLPFELLTEILGFLDFLDIVRCQRISQKFDNLISTSCKLQYFIELGVAGYIDGIHPFNTFQRLNFLKARQEEWKNPDLEIIKTVLLQEDCVQWEFQAGVFLRAMNTRRFGSSGFDVVQTIHLKLTAGDVLERTLSLDSAFSGVEFDPVQGQDLLVVFDRYPRFPCSFVEIFLLSLETGLPHHSAMVPSLKIPFACSRNQVCNVGVKIWNETIVCHIATSKPMIYFIAWRSGTIFATMNDPEPSLRVTSLCCISTQRFAALRYASDGNSQMYLLDIFHLDPCNEQGDPARNPIHLATYQFPKMNFTRSPMSVITSSFPSQPASFTPHDHSKPCLAAPTSGIICIRILSRVSLPQTTYLVFLSPTLFLAADKNVDGTPSIHRWDEWGSDSSRWIRDEVGPISLGFKPYAYRVGSPWRVLDFNPNEIARDLCRQANAMKRNLSPASEESEESEGVRSQIVTQSTVFLGDKHLKQNIISSLAFRETRLEIPEGIKPSAICFVDEDIYFIELEALSPKALHICSI